MNVEDRRGEAVPVAINSRSTETGVGRGARHFTNDRFEIKAELGVVFARKLLHPPVVCEAGHM